MAKTVFLKVTSAFMVGGKVAKAGEVVEVNETDAKDLLHRGKAVLAVIDPADQLDDVVEVGDDETEPAEAETQPAGQADEQPAAPAPAKGKGKGGKKGK